MALLGGMLLAAQPQSALADTRFGVNRVNMAWLKPAEREQIFNQMVENGVVAVRLSLTRPVDQSIDAVRLAHEKVSRSCSKYRSTMQTSILKERSPVPGWAYLGHVSAFRHISRALSAGNRQCLAKD